MLVLSGAPLRFASHADDAVGAKLGHATPGGFSLEITDEFVLVDVVADIEADVHHSRKGQAHILERRRNAVGPPIGWLELRYCKSSITTLSNWIKPTSRRWSPSRRLRAPIVCGAICRSFARDLLVGEHCVPDGIAREVAALEGFSATENFGLEFVGPLHVLDGQAEIWTPSRHSWSGAVLRPAADIDA
ncbi:hypothetical protein [Novosphingobium sp. AP12]|uniref:hypothetical protein n=1 Tax=Novosphingobium sp. AP12 TaxID=1144305 RepID=UPI0005677415|nr:hypothetical protein [Novosphingobium sp. AP12]